MRAQRVLALVVLVLAIVLALGHAPLSLGIFFLFRPSGPTAPRPPPSSQTGVSVPFFAIGAYFLIATVLYILGGIFVASGKLFKLSNFGLVILALVDNLLLIYTRTVPNIFFGRVLSWSWGWYPLGTAQILVGQTILIVLCAILLTKNRNASVTRGH